MQKEQLKRTLIIFICAIALLGLISTETIQAQALPDCWTGTVNEDGEAILVQQDTLPEGIAPQLVYDMLNFIDERMSFGNPNNTVIIQFVNTNREAYKIVQDDAALEASHYGVTIYDAQILPGSCTISRVSTSYHTTGIIIVNAETRYNSFPKPHQYTLFLNLLMLYHEDAHSQAARHNTNLQDPDQNTSRSTEYWERVFFHAFFDACKTQLPSAEDSEAWRQWVDYIEKTFGSEVAANIATLLAIYPRFTDPLDESSIQECINFRGEVLEPNNLIVLNPENKE